MECEEIRELLTKYVDNEVGDEEKFRVEEHLSACRNCKKEYDSFVKLKEVTNSMKFADLTEEMWAGYWKGVYRRIERGTGWIFASIGAIILLAFGVFQFFKEFFVDPHVHTIVKVGVLVLAFGIIILLVSIIRERVFAHKRERYKEIER